MKKSIIRGMRSADEFSRQIRGAVDVPLSDAQVDLLFTIASNPEPMRPSELADFMHVTRPFITKNSNVLQEAGYVQRIDSKHDGRSFTRTLSKSGAALVDGVLGKQYYAPVQKLTEEMGKKKFNKLVRLLDQANEVLRS